MKKGLKMRNIIDGILFAGLAIIAAPQIYQSFDKYLKDQTTTSLSTKQIEENGHVSHDLNLKF